ncbi:MAG TPA: SRPBCC domain-containing protein [Thermoanaerobaculia bacterium]|nr:SRPBCC domain-containing protein [Thermoanaerobaculia bacterium]
MSKQDAVVSEIEIGAPPEAVFRALTDSKELFAWWGTEPSVDLKRFDMDARVGGRWSFEGSDTAGRPVNGVTHFEAHGEIVEMVPPRLLAYTWIANWHDDPKQRTLVRWELEETKTGTRVRVTHSGLARLDVARKDYTGGWPGVLKLLEKSMATSS